MAGGDGSTGKPTPKVVLFVRIPKELRFLADCYQHASRLQSMSDAIQRLLETHPDLTKLAETLYTEGNSTSPPN